MIIQTTCPECGEEILKDEHTFNCPECGAGLL